MRVVILYRKQSEHARTVEEFIREFSYRHASARFETVDVDSRDGIATLSLYGIYQNPAILALADDGRLLQSWSGAQLPLINDVAYYAVPA